MSITAEKVVPNLLIALDIDQTLAGRLIQVHLKEYWRLLHSDAPEIFWQLDSEENPEITEKDIDQEIERQATEKEVKKVFDTEWIKKYRMLDINDSELTAEQKEEKKRREEKFKNARETVRTSQEVHETLESIINANDAINFLLSTVSENISWFTVRPEGVREYTKKWLETHDYPYVRPTKPEDIETLYISADHEDKIIQVLTKAAETNSQAMLIDDSLKQLIEAAEAMNKSSKDKSGIAFDFKGLTLVGFGVEPDEKLITRGKELGITILFLENWYLNSIVNLVTQYMGKPTPDWN